MSNEKKWFLWPDTHFPHHDKRKVSILLNILKEWQPDRLTFLGDLDDMAAPSRFAEGTPDEWNRRIEVTSYEVTDFLRDVRDILPDAEIDYFEGNHEARLVKYIQKNAPALHGLVTPEKIYDLDNLGINWYPYMDTPTKLMGDFYVYHGTTVRGDAGASAKGEMLSLGVSGFSGHTHRLGRHDITYLDRHVRWFECGHLMDLKQAEYGQHFNWQHGYAYAYVDGKKTWVNLGEFQGNVTYFDGKRYS